MSFHMKNRHARRGLQAAAISLFALLASVAHADWGGLNMTEGVTILSKKIYSLHMLILWICVAIARRGVRRDDLFAGQVPEVAGRGGRQDAGPQHQGGNHLDHHPDRDPGVHGGAHRQDAHRDRGHGQRGPQHQGDGLPVEVGVRVPRPERQLLLDAQARQRRGAPARLGHRPEDRP